VTAFEKWWEVQDVYSFDTGAKDECRAAWKASAIATREEDIALLEAGATAQQDPERATVLRQAAQVLRSLMANPEERDG
jgi:hypothetical protein